MTNRELLKCINYVDDKLIVQTNEYIGKHVHKGKRILKSILLVAACIALIVTTCVMSKVSLFNKSSNENITTFSYDSVPPLYAFILDGYIYEVVCNQKTIEREGLPRNIEESMLGEILANDVVRDGQDYSLGDVYEYKEKADRSIVIIKDYTGNYHYALRCNVYDSKIY